VNTLKILVHHYYVLGDEGEKSKSEGTNEGLEEKPVVHIKSKLVNKPQLIINLSIFFWILKLNSPILERRHSRVG
jgi:hypothetical protein